MAVTPAKLVTRTDDVNHEPEVQGLFYGHFLDNLHRKLKPETYLEVGTLAGAALQVAQCASIAVDPGFGVATNVIGRKLYCLFFQETSDEFFRRRNPTALFGRTIDMAFLDGMHMFEFLLRDFMNTERHCGRNSLIVLHDCLPPSFYMTVRDTNDPIRLERSIHPGWWTGDVWKIIPVLRKYRPDLSITITNCAPTGLVLITNLDSKNETLCENYADILQEWIGKKNLYREEYDSYWDQADITHADDLLSFENLSARFWF